MTPCPVCARPVESIEHYVFATPRQVEPCGHILDVDDAARVERELRA